MARRPFISFQAKVLAIIAVAMVALMAATIWVVNSHVTAQLERESAEALVTADSVFRNLQTARAKNLLLRFGNIPNEPRFKAVAQLGEGATMQYLLRELAASYQADAIVYHKPDLTPLASAGNITSNLAALTTATNAGEPACSTEKINAKLYDVISIPVVISDQLVGVLAVAVECGEHVAREFQRLTRCEVVFLAGEIQVLHLGGLALVSVFATDVVVKVLAPRTHAADIERDVRSRHIEHLVFGVADE